VGILAGVSPLQCGATMFTFRELPGRRFRCKRRRATDSLNDAYSVSAEY
jgi:hypothetical protein